MIFQTIEVIIIVILFLLQIYFCIAILRRTRLISTFLSDRDDLGIDSVRTDDSMEMRSKATETMVVPAVERIDSQLVVPYEESTIYFNDMSVGYDDENGQYVFDEKASCAEKHAIIVLETRGHDGILRPYGNIRTMSMCVNREFFSAIFTVMEGHHNAEDPVRCIENGLCARKNGSWYVIRKCIIEM